MRISTIFLSAASAALVLAKTDLAGCTSTHVDSPAGASMVWFVPGNGELCEPLDCGGGRAPPKTTVPGCPGYRGTATYSPAFLAGHAQQTSSCSSDYYNGWETTPSPAPVTVQSVAVTTSITLLEKTTAGPAIQKTELSTSCYSSEQIVPATTAAPVPTTIASPVFVSSPASYSGPASLAAPATYGGGAIISAIPVNGSTIAAPLATTFVPHPYTNATSAAPFRTSAAPYVSLGAVATDRNATPSAYRPAETSRPIVVSTGGAAKATQTWFGSAGLLAAAALLLAL